MFEHLAMLDLLNRPSRWHAFDRRTLLNGIVDDVMFSHSAANDIATLFVEFATRQVAALGAKSDVYDCRALDRGLGL